MPERIGFRKALAHKNSIEGFMPTGVLYSRLYQDYSHGYRLAELMATIASGNIAAKPGKIHYADGLFLSKIETELADDRRVFQIEGGKQDFSEELKKSSVWVLDPPLIDGDGHRASNSRMNRDSLVTICESEVREGVLFVMKGSNDRAELAWTDLFERRILDVFLERSGGRYNDLLRYSPFANNPVGLVDLIEVLEKGEESDPAIISAQIMSKAIKCLEGVDYSDAVATIEGALQQDFDNLEMAQRLAEVGIFNLGGGSARLASALLLQATYSKDICEKVLAVLKS